MKLIYNPIFLEHDTGMHPENKKRLSSLGELPVTKLENGEKYLELVHTPEYIKKIPVLIKIKKRNTENVRTNLALNLFFSSYKSL